MTGAHVSAARLRILIADDNELVRTGVRSILASESNLDVCGEAADGADALQKIRDLQPDLVLLDISMPGVDGLEVTRCLRREERKTKIIIMSQHDPVRLLPRVMDAGANDCVDKARLAADLIPSIQRLQLRSVTRNEP